MLQLLDDKNESLDCSYQHFKCAKPLDFSFKNLITLEELNGNEKPLIQRLHGVPKKNKKSNRYKTGSFWLNNNHLRNINGLKRLADRLLDMSEYLSWLDLSNNNLNIISDEFLHFPHLSMLYLHKNNIEDIFEVYKLRKLTKLKTFTLNRNPMCLNSNYRITIVHMLPELKKLDNVVVLRSERDLWKMPLTKEMQMRLVVAYPEDFGNASKTAI